MITIDELCGKLNFPPELHSFAIWDMQADRVAPVHLHGLYYRAKLATSPLIAKGFVEGIARDVARANFQGFVHNDRLDTFEISPVPMLSGDLRAGLEKMCLEERRCLLFALLMGWSLERVIELTWKEIKAVTGLINDAAWDILDVLPRHFRYDLVFWKSQDQSICRLSNLSFNTEAAFGCTYDKLRGKFATMIFMDPELAAEEVRKHFGVMDQ